MDLRSVILEFKELYKNITLMDFYKRMDMFKREYNKIRTNQYIRLGLIREWRSFIYSLDMELYKKDKIWEFLNDDISARDFSKFIRGVYYGR